jgi:hypothetical protein
MEVQFDPELQAKLSHLAAQQGRPGGQTVPASGQKVASVCLSDASPLILQEVIYAERQQP